MGGHVTTVEEIREAVQSLGLSLTENELEQLREGHHVSLGRLSLGDFALLLYRAESLLGQDQADAAILADVVAEMQKAASAGTERWGLPVKCWGTAPQSCLLLQPWPPSLCLRSDF